MRFTHSEPTRHPRPTVFAAHRDRLLEVVPFLDTVQAVQALSRADHADGTVVLRHRWTGTPNALPALLRPMIPPQALVWEDTTTWDKGAWEARWVITLPALGPVFEVKGTNRFLETPQGCTVEVEGDVALYPDRAAELGNIPPAMLPMIERFAIALVVPLIKQSGHAVAKVLDADPAARR